MRIPFDMLLLCYFDMLLWVPGYTEAPQSYVGADSQSAWGLYTSFSSTHKQKEAYLWEDK